MKKRNYQHKSDLNRVFATGWSIQEKFVDSYDEQVEILKHKGCRCKITWSQILKSRYSFALLWNTKVIPSSKISTHSIFRDTRQENIFSIVEKYREVVWCQTMSWGKSVTLVLFFKKSSSSVPLFEFDVNFSQGLSSIHTTVIQSPPELHFEVIFPLSCARV